MGLWVIVLAVLQTDASPRLAEDPPVVVVEDARAVRDAVGFQVDATFTPTQDEAEAPRRDLARYIETERRREKRGERADGLRRIGLASDRYLWHCGGYVKEGQKYQVCSFVRYEPGELPRLREKHFPMIKDGGISVCHCYFNMRLGRIIRLEWNGEA